MFQDLPPVKGTVDPTSLPLPPGAIPLKEVKMTVQHKGHKGTKDTEDGRWCGPCVSRAASVPFVSSACVALCRERSERADEAARRAHAGRRARGVRAGAKVRLALKVALPEGLHTQSDKPRDPTLIPTVLTIDAPAGRDGRRDRLSAGDRVQAGGPGPAARRVRTRTSPSACRWRSPPTFRRATWSSRRGCATRRATQTSVIRRRTPTSSGRCASCRHGVRRERPVDRDASRRSRSARGTKPEGPGEAGRRQVARAR